MPVEEGKAAPAFRLKDAEGKTVSLKEFRGREVVLYFSPKDNTPGCTKEACGFRDVWHDIQERQAPVLGISPNSQTSHQQFVTKHQLPFPLLCDPDKKVMAKYGAYGEKTLYGKKTLGVIRSTVWVGPDGTVKKHWKTVTKAADHPRKVLEALLQDV